MTVHARQVREALTEIEFENEGRFVRFTSGDVDLAGFIASDVAIYGTCIDTTQFQPFIDEPNAATGMNFTLASVGAAL